MINLSINRKFVDQFRELTDRERFDVFCALEVAFCRHCGSKNPIDDPCKCWVKPANEQAGNS